MGNKSTKRVVSENPQKQPFYRAANNGQASFLDELLGSGNCDFQMAPDDETPLHVAVKKKRTKAVEVILKHRCRIYDKLTKDERELQRNNTNLVETGCTTPIELLKSDGRRVFAEIIWAEVSTPLEIMSTLSRKYTALDLAVRSIQPEMVKLLLSVDQCAYSEEHLRRSFDFMISIIMGLPENAIKRKLTFTKVKEIAHVLLNSGKFNVNALENAFGTPFHSVIEACTYGYLNYPKENETQRPMRYQIMNYVLQLLLMKGADFNVKDTIGETPLMVASKNGCCHVIQILFDWEQKSGMKLDVDARDQNGETALIKAAERQHGSVVQLLLKKKVSVNLYDYYGFTALHAAVYAPNKIWITSHFSCTDLRKREFGHLNHWIKFLSLQTFKFKNIYPHQSFSKLNLYIRDCEQTLLFREETVNVLLSVDEINVNAIDFRGNTPLDLAVKFSQLITSETITALKNRGAIRKFIESKEEHPKAPIHMEMVDERGRNSLHRLSIFLISSHTELGEKTKDELDYAIFDLMVHSILLNPENFRQLATAIDDKGRTPLHYAVRSPSYIDKEDRKLVRVLLYIGSDVNATDMYGKTPLHYTETNDEYELLIKHGAEENTKDKTGHTPRDLMQLRESVRINEDNANKLRIGKKDLYASSDISLVPDTDHVTQLSKRRVAKTVRVYSQSPRPEESSEEAIWQVLIQNDFFRLNRRITQLRPSIQSLIDRLADGIKEQDPRFECQPILVGSADEETKVIMSADFDFNFKLIKFSELCEVFPHPLGPKGYFQLRRKRDDTERRQSDDEFACFFNLDQCLLTNEVNSRFKNVLRDVLHNPTFWQDEHLFEWYVIDVYENKTPVRFKSSLCKTLRLSMINPIEDGEGGFIFIDVFIDVVACVHVDDASLVHQLSVAIGTAVKADGCTFVFNQPLIYGSNYSDTFARISFAPLESRIIRESSSLVKAAYIVCKLILYEFPKVTYQLKTSLLYCIEALKPREGCEKRDENTITEKELAFWVERIMFCLMEFCQHDFYPCYFMPSFKQEVVELTNYYRSVKQQEAEKVGATLESKMSYRYSAAFDIYLDLCPDYTEIDKPNVQNKYYISECNLIANEDLKWEQFDREEFIGKLSSRLVPSAQRNSDVIERNTTVFDIERLQSCE